jgi:hypothetical protein
MRYEVVYLYFTYMVLTYVVDVIPSSCSSLVVVNAGEVIAIRDFCRLCAAVR